MRRPASRCQRFAHVVPERVHRLVRMERRGSRRSSPARAGAGTARAAFRLQQRVLVARTWSGRCRSRSARRCSRRRARPARRLSSSSAAWRDQPLEPGELVVEFRPRLRVAVRAVEARRRGRRSPPPRCSGSACRPGSPGRPARVTTGSAPRARMATPFQVFCPRQTAP